MTASQRKLQIGVMGSAADLRYGDQTAKLAERIGALVAEAGATLVFGAEKDLDSLSTAAARGAKQAGGLVVGITYGIGKEIFEHQVDVVIPTGLERGGGREFVLGLSCDCIITVGGGSGTLNEIAVAYQAGIPIVALKDSGGWSEKLAGQFLDQRERLRIEAAETPEAAVTQALELASSRAADAS